MIRLRRAGLGANPRAARVLAAVLSSQIVLAAARSAAAGVKNPDSFTHLTIGDVDSLDPAWSYDTASHHVIANTYEFLLAYKGSSLTALEPRLASAVPDGANGLLSADGRTYTFPIRQGVKFQDGTPLTPEDVKYSLMRFMLFDRDGGPSGLLLEPILGLHSTRDTQGKTLPDVYARADKAVAVSGDKVSITLHKPYAPFLSILASWGAIVSKSWCAKVGAWDGSAATWEQHANPKDREGSPLTRQVNGTGPFTLDRWDKATKEVILKRFDGYWRGPARLKTVHIRRVEEFATRKLMLSAGDADSIFAPQMYFPQVAEIEGVTVIDGLENLERGATLFFTFKINPTGNPNIGSGKLDGRGIPADFFADKDIRKAIAYSVDYEGYVRDVLRGKGRPATGLIPKGLIGHNPLQKAYRLDLAKAREHLRKAWGGKAWEKGFKFTVMFNDGQPNVLTLCNMIKKNVESISKKFKIDVRTVQWSTYLEQTQSAKVPLFVAAWQADYPDAHNFAFPLLHSQGYFPGKQGYANPEMDSLVEAAAAALDPAERERLYHKLQQIAYEEAPHIYVADGFRYRTQRRWVKGWVFNPVFPDSPYGSYFYGLYKENL